MEWYPYKKNHVRQHNSSFQCRPCYVSRDYSLSKPFNRRKYCQKMYMHIDESATDLGGMPL